MNSKIVNFLSFILLTMTSILVFTTSVHAIVGDTEGNIITNLPGCGNQDSCWITTEIPGYDNAQLLDGIRVTIVDQDGNMVSARSMDYLRIKAYADYVNNDTKYYRCVGNNRNKLGYLNGNSCDWKLNDGHTQIAKHLDWLPYIFANKNAAEEVKNALQSKNNTELVTEILNDIGYNSNENRTNIENHYLIIEPVTLLALGTHKAASYEYSGSHYRYYGTYYELHNKWKEKKFTWVGNVIKGNLPLSIYAIGNTEIKGSGGYDSTNGSYFKGKIQVANTKKHTETFSNGTRTRLKSAYYNNQSLAYGLGIFWMKDLINEPQKCDYNNSGHFATNNSGPNGENCCNYVKNNLSEYGITEAEFYSRYPQCNSTLNSCTFNLTTNYPTCGENSIGKISDIDNWDCIYASAYSNDTSIKNYFIKYGSPTDTCSVYCRNEIDYIYPSNGMITLAGNYFTIGRSTSSYAYYLDSDTNTIKVSAATLGPIQISVTKQCSILGDINNNTCKNKLQQELNNIQAPTVEFTYQSSYYNDPVETLTSTKRETPTENNNGIHSKTVTYNYSLPDSTYKYVSKNTGISYKNTSSIGKYPYITIGNHLPIHFSQNDKTNNYQLTIKKINLANFDNLILNGKKMATRFDTSIETYIKILIDTGQARPVNINGIYYLNNDFISLLEKKGYNINDFLQSPCGNTNNYTCYGNNNGVYCYDEGKTSNSEQTYAYFNSCIINEVSNIKSQNSNYSTVSYRNNMVYKCNFEVDRPTTNSDNVIFGPTINSDNVIFRPISLDNPFPGKNSEGRETGINWCYGDNDCSNNNPVVKNIITNNRGVETENIYKDLDPLYKIVLTPTVIKEIRKYNNDNPYDDFNLVCDSNSNNCKSNFIRNSLNNGKYNFSNHFSGCGITNKSNGLNCQEADKW